MSKENMEIVEVETTEEETIKETKKTKVVNAIKKHGKTVLKVVGIGVLALGAYALGKKSVGGSDEAEYEETEYEIEFTDSDDEE